MRHEAFEELCAAAATGQLSGEEMAALKAHLEECAACRNLAEEFREIALEYLPLADRGSRHFKNILLHRKASRECRQAFLERARTEDIPLSAQSDAGAPRWMAWPLTTAGRYYPAVALVILVFAVALLTLRVHSGQAALVLQEQEFSQRIAGLEGENAALRNELGLTQSAQLSHSAEDVVLQQQRFMALERARSVEQMIAATHRQAQELRDLLARSGAEKAQLEQRLAADAQLIAEMKGSLDKLREARANDEATLLAQRHRLEELSEQVRLQAATLDRERQLLAAGRDIRDLMGARSLHIIDVHDVDQRGKVRKAFGRVFYTEGKSLIFYAFDLGGGRRKNASFQAWGQREDGTHRTVNLGIFFVDDHKQSRWVLKFDNPSVLREIDSVFVTMEPPGGGKQPSGQKLLYAFLGNQPNHP